jgi:hypothetical protein
MTDPRERIAEVLDDYRAGLLDSREEAVDAIVEALGGDEALRLIVIKGLELGDAEEAHPRP